MFNRPGNNFLLQITLGQLESKNYLPEDHNISFFLSSLHPATYQKLLLINFAHEFTTRYAYDTSYDQVEVTFG